MFKITTDFEHKDERQNVWALHAKKGTVAIFNNDMLHMAEGAEEEPRVVVTVRWVKAMEPCVLCKKGTRVLYFEDGLVWDRRKK